MSYLVFARKWRPQNFDQVIGQEHIATTLKNAISLDRVGHAYLFSGPRGTGKTSTARILAKALNCEKGPLPVPCNKCISCVEISKGCSLDVFEIDGASNRGIEQIRQLRENVKFAPAKSRFKIYIIDEVHQITTDGFNALLKTLEEPPKHVKFIFATTQFHKVLPTILSRCQRFDFRPLPVALIVQKLKYIGQQEKLKITDEALMYVGRLASGSMRDAESILDQLSSASKGQITLDVVTNTLGMIDLETLEHLAQEIIDKKTPEALNITEKVIEEGKDLFQFTTSLMDHFRNILIAKSVDQKKAEQFIDLPKERIVNINKQAKALSLEELFYIFGLLTHLQENLRGALSARVLLEVAIIKLTQRANFSSLDNMLKRLADLERALTESDTFSSNDVFTKTTPLPVKNKLKVSSSTENKTTKDEHSSNLQEEIWRNWPTALKAIKSEKMFVASALEFAKVRQIDELTLGISFAEKHTFYQETLDEPDNKRFVEAKLKEIFKRNLTIKVSLDKNLTGSKNQDDYIEEELSVDEEGGADVNSASALKKPSSDAIIKSALKIFDGRIIRRTR